MPIIGPMVGGRGTRLPREAQRIVATWVFKTALMLSFSSPGTHLRGERETDCRYLYDNRAPPTAPGATVFIAAFGGSGQWQLFFHFQPLVLADHTPAVAEPPNTYLATLAVGHFVGQAISSHVPDFDGTGISPTGPLANSMRTVWPHSPIFVWPTGPFLSERSLYAVAKTDLPPVS